MPLSQERCQGPTLRDSGSPWYAWGVEKNLEGFEQVSTIFEAHKVENYPQNGPFWGSKMDHFEACLLTEIALKNLSVDEKFYFLIIFVGLTLLFKMSPKTSESVHGAQSGTPKRY